MLIFEGASLYEAIERFDECKAAFTLFGIDGDRRVTGALSRGDVLRCLQRHRPSLTSDLEQLVVADAMTRREALGRAPGMLYVEWGGGPSTWYQQLTDARGTNLARWQRIKLVPVLDEDWRLVDVLDLESPRTRARLETVVMAAASPIERSSHGDISLDAIAARRFNFDSVSYRGQGEKIRALCDVLLRQVDGRRQMLEAVFRASRADELFLGIERAEEWLNGYVLSDDMSEEQRGALLSELGKVRTELVATYKRKGIPELYSPDAPAHGIGSPLDTQEGAEVIIVLGCRAETALRNRVSAALDVARHVSGGHQPTVVLSGGGDGQGVSEARRMLDMLQKDHRSLRQHTDNPAVETYSAKIGARTVEILLEEDSLDTLGNAVFSWLTLKLNGRHALEAAAADRLSRLVIVTDRMHAPRSHDVFRRVFAFRPTVKPRAPAIAVRTVDWDKPDAEEPKSGLAHLKSESKTNAEIFRLVNPLTNGLDVVEDGHVRSILGQMLRLHDLYRGRWDLVRKYRAGWSAQMSD